MWIRKGVDCRHEYKRPSAQPGQMVPTFVDVVSLPIRLVRAIAAMDHFWTEMDRARSKSAKLGRSADTWREEVASRFNKVCVHRRVRCGGTYWKKESPALYTDRYCLRHHQPCFHFLNHVIEPLFSGQKPGFVSIPLHPDLRRGYDTAC